MSLWTNRRRREKKRRYGRDVGEGYPTMKDRPHKQPMEKHHPNHGWRTHVKLVDTSQLSTMFGKTNLGPSRTCFFCGPHNCFKHFFRNVAPLLKCVMQFFFVFFICGCFFGTMTIKKSKFDTCHQLPSLYIENYWNCSNAAIW